jgi:hypothetical protein
MRTSPGWPIQQETKSSVALLETPSDINVDGSIGEVGLRARFIDKPYLMRGSCLLAMLGLTSLPAFYFVEYVKSYEHR